jgi:arylsulfatase A-like enzyme
LVDLYPTLAELCGLPKPAGIEGHSFASLINNPQADWSHPAITVIKNGRSIRTERWRYAEYNGEGGGAMLFDEQSDPHEMKNLAGDPRYADTISELKAAMSREIGNKN